ncbi:MAG: DUF922 domain-containing protein [Desulfobulbus sp.]|nr:DUF922 domain-containing protein [Desulfobulbus sp.]
MRLLIQTVTYLVLFYLSILPAKSETYKWVDDKGVMNFSDNLLSVPRKNRKQITDPANSDELIHKPSFVSAKNKSSKEVNINENHDYYDIKGITEQELQQQMNSSGFVEADGKSHYAYTNWYVKWNYTYLTNSTNCLIATATTTVDLTFHLPKWINSDAAPENLTNKWDRFFRNLELHEYGHKEIGVQAAKEIVKAIKSMEPRASCQELGEAANSLGQLILQKWKQEEVEYDVRTNHGIIQGAKFP